MSASASAANPLLVVVTCEASSARHVHVLLATCDIHLEGDIRKYIMAIIQSECMISTGGITMYYMSVES